MFQLSPLPRTLAAALRDLRHEKVDVRASAVRDLARLAETGERTSALAALAGVLLDDKASDVRAEAALALADASAHAHIPELVRATREPHARVRQMAVLALGELAGCDQAEARNAIERALHDDSPALRFQALIAITRVLGEEADSVIVRMLDDADEHVRYVAVRLLEERWSHTEKEELPPELGARVHAALSDSSDEVRLIAALLLAESGDRSGVAMIAAAVNARTGAREPEDEELSIELAGELCLEAARPGLERRAFSVLQIRPDPFRWHARIALAKMGDERARRAILRSLSSWTRDARTLGVVAAGRARLHEASTMILEMRGRADRADPEAVEEALRALVPRCGEADEHTT